MEQTKRKTFLLTTFLVLFQEKATMIAHICLLIYPILIGATASQQVSFE